MTTIVAESSANLNPDAPTARPLLSTDVRGLRYELRERLHDHAAYYGGSMLCERLSSWLDCGQPLGSQVLIGQRGTSADMSGHFGNVARCGAAWSCPSCAAKVGTARADEISQAVTHFQDNGGTVAMLTLTMRHRRSDNLTALWKGLSAAWKAATNGRAWRKDRKSFNVEYVRAVEATWSEANGWHLHVHALLLFPEQVGRSTLHAFRDSMFDRWRSKLVDLGFQAPILMAERADGKTVGADIKRIRRDGEAADDGTCVVAKYLTKIAASIGFEVGGSTAKKGRQKGHFSPWQLAQLAVTDHDREHLYWRTWAEWAWVSKGKRAINWSRGLRDLVGLGAEKSDEELANEGEQVDRQIGRLTVRDWWELRRQRPELLGDLLKLAAAPTCTPDDLNGYLLMRGCTQWTVWPYEEPDSPPALSET